MFYGKKAIRKSIVLILIFSTVIFGVTLMSNSANGVNVDGIDYTMTGGPSAGLSCKEDEKKGGYNCSFVEVMGVGPSDDSASNKWTTSFCMKPYGWRVDPYGSAGQTSGTFNGTDVSIDNVEGSPTTSVQSTPCNYVDYYGSSSVNDGHTINGWHSIGQWFIGYSGLNKAYYYNRKEVSRDFFVEYSDFKKEELLESATDGYKRYLGCIRYYYGGYWNYWINDYNQWFVNHGGDMSGWENTSRTAKYNNAIDSRNRYSWVSPGYCYYYYDYIYYTLTLKSIDTNGNSLSSVSGLGDKSERFIGGNAASLTRRQNEGYSFKGFKNSKGDAEYVAAYANSNSYTSDSGDKYNLRKITRDTTAYAVYEKQNRTLTLKAVDTEGNSISEIANVTSTVEYGASTSVTRASSDGWTFEGFKEATSQSQVPKSAFVSDDMSNQHFTTNNGKTFAVKSLKQNATVYAVYSRSNRSLTLKAVDENGNSISKYISDATTSVNYGENADVRRKSDSDGYKFLCFKEVATGDCIESTDPEDDIYIVNLMGELESLVVKNLIDNRTVYAAYQRFKLNVYGRDIYTNDSISDANQAVYGNGYVSVTRIDLSERTDLAPVGYKFIGWKNKASKGRNGLIDDDSISGNSGITITRNLTANDKVYAYYLKKMVLTVDQGEGTRVTVTRGSSNLGLGSTGTIYEDNNMIISNGRLYDGDIITVKMELLPGYTWESHSLVSGDKNETTSIDITNFEVRDNVTITTRATLDRFEGLSSVRDFSTKETKTNGWTNESGTVIQTIDCTVNGCQADFQHALKRTAGAGSVVYKITRTSNYTGKGVNSGTMAESTTLGFSSNDNGVIVRNQDDSRVMLYPGQVVCETLSFKPNVNHEEINIRACASAVGDAQPGDTSLLKIHVRNQSVPKYGEYAKSIYAKPGDTVDYRAEYNPRLQYTYNLKPQAMQINNRSVFTNSLSMTSELFFNSLASSNGVRNWNNDFSTVVYSRAATATSGGSALTSTNYDFLNGTVSEQIKNKTYKIPSSQAGKAVDGVAVTNYTTSTQTTPSQITFYQSGDKNVAKVLTAAASDTARVIVPYNFILRAQIANEVSEVVYAGETFSIKINAIVKKKTNSETTDGSEAAAYATKADSTKRRVIYYVLDDGVGVVSGADEWGNVDSDICTYFGRTRNNNCDYANSSDNIGLNTSGSLSGYTNQFTMSAVNVPDLDAGTQVCAAVALYPATSGADTSTDVNGNGKWTVSDSKCFKIAKRPSFQVWGGNMYSLGNANIPVSTKNNLKGIYDYSYNGNKSNTVIFGSWVEHDVTAGGLISGLASGAATGKITLPGKDIQVEGSFEGSSVSYCENRVPLSLANFTTSSSSNVCKNNTANGVTGSSGVTSTLTNKSTLISYLLNKASEYTTYSNGETVDLSDNYNEISNDNGKSVRLTNGSGALTVTSSSVIGDGVTHLVKAGGDVTINSDIIYNNGSITSLAQVPKLLIYAKNIIVGCDVNRVDAILIAENNVNTCKSGEGESINDQKNSRQLKVNGVIITDTMDLNRTYGATAGEGSGVPAEIINYDTSTVLWGRDMAAGDNYNGLNSVYQHELAPRY